MKTIIALGLLISSLTFAKGVPTVVGNGDNGSDLEKLTSLTDSRVLKARDQSLELLRQLNISSVKGLGILEAEVKSSELFLVESNAITQLESDRSTFHSNMQGNVFARTMAQPHASTRFFPAALKLSEEQLSALQIHEALHRSLPEPLRENEPVVSEITLAITAQGANRDNIESVMQKHMANVDSLSSSQSSPIPANTSSDNVPVSEDSRVLAPNSIGITDKRFQIGAADTLHEIREMISIQSFLYPFGGRTSPFGFGIEATMIGFQNKGYQAGPLGLSARLRLWSSRGFDLEIFGAQALNMLSTQEMMNSPLGRDVTTIGIGMRKDLDFAFFENKIFYNAPGRAVDKAFAGHDMLHEFGSVVFATIRGGARLWKFELGGFTEIALGDYYKISQDSEVFKDSGRYRLISGGPEVSFTTKNIVLTVQGRFIIDTTQGASYDYIGNLLGQGAASGNIAANVRFHF